MRKHHVLLIPLLIYSTIGTVFGTGVTESDTKSATNSVELPTPERVSDTFGHTINVGPYRRMVVVAPAAVETLFLIGAEDTIAAIGTSRNGIWPYDRTTALPSVGSVARPNLEEIISYDPELTILSAMSVDLGEDLSRRGYRVFIYSANSIEEVFSLAHAMGKLTGREEETTRLLDERRTTLERITAKISDRPTKLSGAFLYATNPVMGFTDHSLPGEILRLLGITNIAANLSGERPIVSSELLIAEDPDVLFVSMSVESVDALIVAEPTILKTRAGREGNIQVVDSALILRPTPRVVDGILTLSEKLSTIPPRSDEK